MTKLLIDRSLCLSDAESFSRECRAVKACLTGLSRCYPEFDKWYAHKVLPGLESGERAIIVRKVEDEIAGVAIVKRTESETKLCCLRIAARFQGVGIGIRLFKDAFDILETERPLLSIADSRRQCFERPFEYFGFSLWAVYPKLYRPKSVELSFNGLLS